MSGIDVYENQQSALLVLEDGVDALTVAKFRHLCDDLLGQGIIFFIIDLSQTQTMDSAGIAVLVYLFKRCRNVGGAMKIGRNMSPAAQRILRLTRFDRIFEVVDIHHRSFEGMNNGYRNPVSNQPERLETYQNSYGPGLSQNAVALDWQNNIDSYLHAINRALYGGVQLFLSTTIVAFLQRVNRQFSVG